MADHIFICYARKDEAFVLQLATRLKSRGVPVWLDQWDIPPSADWDQTIDEAIESCVHFLIVLSPAAIKSREVKGEYRLALDENKPILPVLHQECRIPRQLRLYQYVDFRNRQPDDVATLGLALRALGVTEPISPAEEAARVAPPVALDPPSPKPAKILPDRLPFEPEMILIPAGEFLMGSDPKKDKQALDHEQPQHTLYLPDYYVAKTPVTEAQYAAFMQVTDHQPPDHWKKKQPPAGIENHPVVNVSWYGAVAYCRWLAEITHRPYRRPTEAEWEKAARGPDSFIYPWGNQWDKRRCNSREGGKSGTTPVGTYPDGASPYGLLDMAGNVWEWCAAKWQKAYPYDVKEDEWSANYLDGTDRRVLRGGAFHDDGVNVRCSRRFRHNPDFRYDFIGFRVVVSPI